MSTSFNLAASRARQYASCLPGDPAGNAKAFIHAYQERTHRFHTVLGRMENAQGFCNWRTGWLVECLARLPSWQPDAFLTLRKNVERAAGSPGRLTWPQG